MPTVTIDVSAPGSDDLQSRILTSVQRLQAEGYTVNSAVLEGSEENLADLQVQDELSPQRIVEREQLRAQELRGVTPDPVPDPDEDEEEEEEEEPEPEPAKA